VGYSLCIEEILLTSAAIVVKANLFVVMNITVCNDDHFVTIVHAEMRIGARAVIGVAAS
jgi:hypothetical protein